jgi:hypothetical protein
MNRLFLATFLVGTLLAAHAAAQDSAAKVEAGPNADLGGRRLLPDESPWYRDVSMDRVDRNSNRILARIGMSKPLHADFISGAPHPGWDVDALRQLRRVQTKDLEVVEMNDVVIDRRR